MKKKIIILGSTGFIGKSLLKLVNKNKKNFKIILLSTNKNYKEIIKQANFYNVKNLIINDKKTYDYLIKKKFENKFNLFNNFDAFSKILKFKVDYTMNAISGLDGLIPTINIIKFTKTIAIANKESIICGWNIISNQLKKNNTKFIPVDSEHFSLWYDNKNIDFVNIKEIFLTASGGPFLNYKFNKLKNVKISDALNHPNWKMGKKISIDSATMMNKVFEVIEAKNIFNIPYKKIKILIHPGSYIHSILTYNDGMIKIICHETTMKIPIFNTLYNDNINKKIITKKISLAKLNNLKLSNPNISNYPVIKILNFLPNKHSLFETIIVSANDYLVELFLKKQIKFQDISKKFLNIVQDQEFKKYKHKKPNSVSDIVKLNNFVRYKINSRYI